MTGEPENCVELRLDTDTEFDVQVDFVRTVDGFLPVLTFCPDEDVLALPAEERARYVMTSVEEDVADPAIQNRRTYEGVGGLDCTSSQTIGFGGGSRRSRSYHPDPTAGSGGPCLSDPLT